MNIRCIVITNISCSVIHRAIIDVAQVLIEQLLKLIHVILSNYVNCTLVWATQRQIATIYEKHLCDMNTSTNPE